MYDSIIIGSGPAGLTAAIYLSRAGLKNALIDGPEPGGQITTTTEVENFPGFPDGIMGPDLIENIQQQAKSFGTLFISSMVKKIEKQSKGYKICLEDNQVINTQSIILSTGASAKYLHIEGELENLGRGVSACATCDGFFYKEQEVVVVGGGDTAMEEALFLTRFASKVTVIHRRDKLRASKIMQDRARQNDKIEWKLDYTPKKIIAAEMSVTGIELINNKTNNKEIVSTSGVFIAIGHKPNTDFVKEIVDLDKNGYVITQAKSARTTVEGIFAAGDVQDDKYRQAITAAGTGAMAALNVENYLTNLEIA